ncbi:hypothetical protein AB0M47_11025 [Hamadaea sp. NPDC051192]|uniref:hypothetical protein n=1 Tax=Hamadaea sp. NPDC051192 TaxID=3154940 RepID=UPI003428DA73
MSQSSIDELLGGAYEDEERPQRSGRPVAAYAKAFGAALALTFVGVAALRTAKLDAPAWFIFLVSCALVLVYIAVRQVRPPLPSRAAGRRHLPDSTPDGLRHAVKRWEARLDWCHADASAFNRKVIPALGEIVDERLRQRHGITRESDPARARNIVGEPLWTFLSAPVRRPPAPRELANLIAWMERI